MTDPERNPVATLQGAIRLLYAGPFVSMFDRFAIAPLLIPIAQGLHVPVGQVALVASVYYFVYGAMEPVHGMLADHLGRVRVLRLALLGIAIAGLVSTFAPTLLILAVGRAATGAFVAAVIPVVLVYIGDSYPFAVRQRVIANLGAAVALGTATATLGAGLLADHVSWRAAFAVPAIAALVLFVASKGIPESKPADSQRPLERFRRVFSERWTAVVLTLGFLEGATLYGFFTYLAPALQAQGFSASTAGLVVAAYGGAVLVSTLLVKRASLSLSATLLLLIGGVALLVGYVAVALVQSIPSVLICSLLAGLAYGFMHSTLQTWATEYVPQARGTATSLFACSLFIGAALSTGLSSPLVQAHHFATIFWLAAAITVPLAAGGAFARWRYATVG